MSGPTPGLASIARVLALLLAFGGLAGNARAQGAAPAGAPGLAGTVTDQLGAALPGVTVTATDATGAVYVAHSDAAGAFSLTGLPSGRYSVLAELAGFAPDRRADVDVVAGSTATLEIKLGLLPHGETMVVTGSRKEELVRYAPAAITVVGGEAIEAAPVDYFADVLRHVPGVNVIQFSARDVQFTARAAVSQASNKTLALVDGRSAYQPYFGMLIWDLLAVDFDEIKQVEVVRGPGSAMWGTNALTGVVNIITKAPREDVGTHVRVGAGDRSTVDLGVRHAGARGRLGYKVGASFFRQDAWDRPATLPDGTPLAPYDNADASMAQGNVRLDYARSEQEKWRFDGGFAATDGMLVTVIGPLDSQRMRQGYGRAQLEHGAWRAGVTADFHDSSYIGVLSGDVTDFRYQTVHAEAGRSLTLPRQVVTVAGIARFNHFDINVVPDQHTRQELGVVADDEVFLGDRVRLRLGGRVDWFSSFGVTASPRVGVVVEPARGHTVRASYGRAYVAPSFLENYFYFPTQTVIGLPTGPYALPFVAQGNDALDPLTLDAFEVGYTGVVGPQITFGVAAYRNRTKGLISLVPTAFYSSASPPPGWPLPPFVLDALPLPSELTEQNLGQIDDAGVELSVDAQPARGIAVYANYSFQNEPDVSPEVPIATNIPARHRFNAGASFSRGRYLGNASLSTVSRAFWADVQPYQGWTDGYALVSAAAGVRIGRPGVASTLMLKAIDVTNRGIRQHIFSDVMRRRVSLELRVDF